jgi:hypothetical protein
MYNREKAIEQLNEVQKGCKARLLTIEDIEQCINICEKWLIDHNTPEFLMPYIHYEYYQCVPNAYKYPGDATKLFLAFTKEGKVKTVEVKRDYTQNISNGGVVSRFRLNTTALKELRIDWFDTDEKNKEVKNRFIRSYGFNPGTLTAQV